MTINTLRKLVSTAVLAIAFAACGGGNKPTTTTGGGGGGSGSGDAAAACTPDECAKVAEPPIDPMACGAGKEKDIGTVCQRQGDGSCAKVLQCAGAAPAAPAPTTTP